MSEEDRTKDLKFSVGCLLWSTVVMGLITAGLLALGVASPR
jgi:hypothetical protein